MFTLPLFIRPTACGIIQLTVDLCQSPGLLEFGRCRGEYGDGVQRKEENSCSIGNHVRILPGRPTLRKPVPVRPRSNRSFDTDTHR